MKQRQQQAQPAGQQAGCRDLSWDSTAAQLSAAALNLVLLEGLLLLHSDVSVRYPPTMMTGFLYLTCVRAMHMFAIGLARRSTSTDSGILGYIEHVAVQNGMIR